MTVSNVSMSWCLRQANCHYCETLVEAGTPLVTVFFWNKGTEEHKGFNSKFYYHPTCWVNQGLEYLRNNPYVPYKRTRTLPITQEQRVQRNILLRRKCSLDQRKRNLKMDFPDRVLVEARIDTQIVELMLEIAPIGGIPKRWLLPWEG